MYASSKWTPALAALVIILLVGACSGGTAVPTVGPTPTALPPTAVPAIALPLDGDQTRSICLEVDLRLDPPAAAGDVTPARKEKLVQRVLTGMGSSVVGIGEPCDATLSISVTVEALGASYQTSDGGSQSCYTGAEANGKLTLTVPEYPPLDMGLHYTVQPRAGMIHSCPGKTEFPFESAWTPAVLERLGDIWGAPLLAVALRDTDGDSDPDWCNHEAISSATRLLVQKEQSSLAIPALLDIAANVPYCSSTAYASLGSVEPDSKEELDVVVSALIGALSGANPAACNALIAITGADWEKEGLGCDASDIRGWQRWWREKQ